MKIAFLASPKPEAQETTVHLIDRYGQSDPVEADYLVVVGGDGTVLKALHGTISVRSVPVFGMRIAGSIGRLANPLRLEELPERLRSAREVVIHPLSAEADHPKGTAKLFAVNDIALTRHRLQAAKLHVKVGGRELPRLVGDGLLVATPIGSGGYNRSAGGICLQHGSTLLTLTAIAPHYLSPWCNLVVNDTEAIEIEVIDPDHRPVRLETSLCDLANVRRVRIALCHHLNLMLLFDAS